MSSEFSKKAVLRRLEHPYRFSGRELVRRLCLSVGLVQESDSRDVVVDILHSLLRSDVPLSHSEIARSVCTLRQRAGLDLKGCALSNIRRQTLRLRRFGFVEQCSRKYRAANIVDAFENFEKIYLSDMIRRVKDYCKAVESERNGKDVS
ncbi:hypothetical protein D6825_00110 [Candidatus Woesearchaeota archaeon]|nr:MAG: hypothetical protein D6825_00110 [Candidatus Woesearchaeota archaeon]